MAEQITVTLELANGQVLTSRSYFTACEPMWQEAGADLVAFDGSRAIHILSNLETAVEAMQSDPSTYEDMNPGNGEGDSTGCLAFLQILVDDCNHHPKATMHTTTSTE
jgi:hypothetical protein